MQRSSLLRLLGLVALAGLPLACGLPERVEVELLGFERLDPLPGYETVRALQGYPSEAFQVSFDQAVAQVLARPRAAGARPSFDMLVLSSGGVNGAFGAGVLAAWSESGERPAFDMVTGVSVGALLAPFAFAGSAYDDRIEALFRRVERSDIMEEQGIVSSLFFDESLMDNDPLMDLIAAGIDAELLAAVAARHAEGARLYVGTTNLDRGQFVVWDLGAVASLGGDEALAFFRRVLLASASIPVVYPPVRFRHAGGDEMHVDGAVARSMFLPQGVFDIERAIASQGLSWWDVDATLYVVHNGCLRIQPQTVQRETLKIATRTILLMTYTAVTEHVQNLYLISRLFGAEFRFLTIPDGQELALESFDADDAEALYLLGRAALEDGPTWSSAPPGYVVGGALLELEAERDGKPVGP
jgi:hypothetical protein